MFAQLPDPTGTVVGRAQQSEDTKGPGFRPEDLLGVSMVQMPRMSQAHEVRRQRRRGSSVTLQSRNLDYTDGDLIFLKEIPVTVSIWGTQEPQALKFHFIGCDF